MPKQVRRKQILIVDPDPGAALRLRGVLEGLGYRGVAGRPAEAMALARGLRLHLALLDAATPAEDLDHLATQLHRAAVPVIVLYPDTAPPPTVAGATAYLPRAWRAADLVQLVYRYAGAPE